MVITSYLAVPLFAVLVGKVTEKIVIHGEDSLLTDLKGQITKHLFFPLCLHQQIFLLDLCTNKNCLGKRGHGTGAAR